MQRFSTAALDLIDDTDHRVDMADDTNGTSASSKASHNLRFQAVDTKSAVEHNELVRQRRLCGWGEPDIASWKKLIENGDRVRPFFYLIKTLS